MRVSDCEMLEGEGVRSIKRNLYQFLASVYSRATRGHPPPVQGTDTSVATTSRRRGSQAEVGDTAMAMAMAGEQQLAASRETVWAKLNDPEVLKSCIPGCESLD